MCIILHLHILQLSKQGKNGEQGEKGVAGRPGQKVRRSSYSHLHVKCDSSDIYASLSNGVVFLMTLVPYLFAPLMSVRCPPKESDHLRNWRKWRLGTKVKVYL